MTTLESKFQAKLIKELRVIFPNCIILKNDANYIQGMPDLLILYGDRWAALETKRKISARHQLNQDYYVRYLNDMSYASFISPENKAEVLNELQRSLRPARGARLPRG